jgi:hypothetical protein
LTDNDWILDALRPHGFSPEEVQEYEITVDRINTVIGIYSARLDLVRDDPAEAAPLRAEVSRWVQIQKGLRIGDRERVAEIRRECDAIIREARGRPALPDPGDTSRPRLADGASPDAAAPPLARSSLEAHLYMDLHPCECGETKFERASVVVELPGGDLARRYTGRCPSCGTEREFVFRLPAEPPDLETDEIRYGDAQPSELLDAGEWLWVADSYARSVPPEPHRLPEPDRGRARARLASAAAAIDEVLKLVPPGEDEVPRDAVRSRIGAPVYEREPGRFRVARLIAVRDAYRSALRLFD